MNRLKTKIHYDNIAYDFRPNQGQVICNLKFFINLNEVPCIETLIKNKKFKKIMQKYNFKYYDYKDGTYPDIETRVIGYADKREEDVFDSEFGRKLALTRAQQKVFEISRDFYNECYRIIADLLFDSRYDTKDTGILSIERLMNNCWMSFDNCKKHIKTLIDRKYDTNNI